MAGAKAKAGAKSDAKPRFTCQTPKCGLDLTAAVQSACHTKPHFHEMLVRDREIADAVAEHPAARRVLDLVGEKLTAASVDVQCANGHWNEFPCGGAG